MRLNLFVTAPLAICATNLERESQLTFMKETLFLYHKNSAKTIEGVTAIFAIW